MATREEKIAFLQRQSSVGPTREEKIAFLKAQSERPPEGVAQTALESFGNGASAGYLPQLQAAAAKPIYSALNYMTGQDVQPDSYVDERDANIARQAKQAKDNPATAFAGNVAGTVASGVATSPLMPARAATIAGRIAQAGKIGTVIGAASNPGDTQGEVNTNGQIPARLINARNGGALAMLLGGLIESPNIAKSGASVTKDLIAKKLGQDVSFTPVANKEAIEIASKNLGIKDIPKAVLTDNKTFQKLESGLSQSGSLPAKGVREQYNNFFKALEEASEKISSLKTTDSEFASGQKIQADLAKQIGDNRAPVSKMYEDLTPHLRKIEVNQAVVNKSFGALKRNPLFQTQDGAAMLREYQDAAKGVSDLASLKEWRSTLRDAVGPSSTPLEAKRIEAIAKTVTSIRDNSINSLKEHMPKDLHGEVDNLIGDIALADAAHSANIKDINSIKSIVGNKNVSSPSTFLNKLSGVKESDIAQKASNLDVGTLQNLKQKFPSVFEKAKAAKINDLIQNSTNPISGFSDARFLKQYQGMDQELKNLIFDPKIQTHIESLNTLKSAIPDKLGPSGTPEGKMMMDMFNPKRNALDYGIKKTLESTSKAPVAEQVAEVKPSMTAKVLKFSVATPTAKAGTPVGSLRSVADDKAPKKGTDKWADDGYEKLLEHADPDDKAMLEQLKDSLLSSAQGKKLLINASDLKPGSRAMDKLLTQAKQLNRVANEGGE